MSLEDRIVKRWQQWCRENKAFELPEEKMKELIAMVASRTAEGIALKEVEQYKPTTAREIIKYCHNKGISVSEFLGVPKLPKDEAVNAYINGEITEGRLMQCLECDRLEARRIVQEFTGEVQQ